MDVPFNDMGGRLIMFHLMIWGGGAGYGCSI